MIRPLAPTRAAHGATVKSKLGCVAAAVLAVTWPPASSWATACRTDAPFRVAIDVGHSPDAPGAKSAAGKREYEFNDRFARELLALSKARSTLEAFILNPNGENLSLMARTQLAASRQAKLFVSIHHDSVNPKYLKRGIVDGATTLYTDAFRGYSLFVYSANPAFRESHALAVLIGTNLKTVGRTPTLHHAEAIDGENRKLINSDLGVYDAPFAVLRTSSSPAVLIEIGVLPNPVEEEFLERPEHREKMALAILDALETFCKGL
jgi:N-acetylmuramoyl-L-alanine amidase